MLQTLLHSKLQINLREAICESAKMQPITISCQANKAICDFITRRLEQLLVETGIRVEVARAIMNERSHNPVLASISANDLQVSDFGPAEYFLHFGRDDA